MNKAALEIIRFLRVKNAVTKTLCYTGGITVLTDSYGDGSLMPYALALSGQAVKESFSIMWQGASYNPTEHYLVGFNEKLPETLNIEQYLAQVGYSGDEIVELIEAYDLEKMSYLNCAQLSSTASRQIQLLAAFRSDAPVLVLNDPFQPFSGRWREHFAEELLAHATEHDKVVVITNLSFEPQLWAKNDAVKFSDVGKAAEHAAKKAEAMAKIEAAVAEAAEQIPDEPKEKKEKTFDFELPEYIVFAYSETRDFIFEPLARLAGFLRGFSGPVVVGMVALLVLVMGFVMFPNLGESRAKLKELAKNFNWTKTEEVVKTPKAKSKPKARTTTQLAKLSVIAPETTIIDESTRLEKALILEKPNEAILQVAVDSSVDPEHVLKWLSGENSKLPMCYVEVYSDNL